jgi:hypothetical protein
METKFKRHQKVKLKITPFIESIEPYTDPPEKITKGMESEINLILPNGKYHVRVFNTKHEVIAYVVVDEEGLEPIKNL